MHAARHRGFTYLGVMFIVSVLAMTAAMAASVWSTQQRRDNERELLFVGKQYQQAIEHYRSRSTGAHPPYPRRLDDLLLDARAPRVQRDLRQRYPDPLTGSREWGVIRLPDGGIVGVHSLSERSPLKRDWKDAVVAFPQSKNYRDWRFIAPSAVELLASAAGVTTDSAGSEASAARAADAAPVPLAEAADAPTVDQGAGPSVSAPRPSSADYASRTPEACSRIAAYEEQTCAQQALRVGEESGRLCAESALKRSIACSVGAEGPLPALIRRGY